MPPLTPLAAQQALSILGYRPGALDGVWGARSQAALATFAQRESIPPGASAEAVLAHLQARLQQARQFSAATALTPEQLQAILGARGVRLSAARLGQLYPGLAAALAEGCLSATPQRQASFLAQLFHESGGLQYMQEIASGKDYEGRRDLGNTQPGDGERYKGRGPIQLTGRFNYRAAGAALGLDLEGHPEQAAVPAVGFRVAVWYWTSRNLNAIADEAARDPEAAFRAITTAINGGLNGLNDRRAWLGVCWRVLTAA